MADAAITVRRARAHDLQALLDVHVAHGGREPGDASEAEVRAWVRMMATDDLAVYLAEADGHVAGTASSIHHAERHLPVRADALREDGRA